MRNEALKACHRLGYAIWKKWSGYHRRSLVEIKMHLHGPPKENKLWSRESLKGLQPYIRVLFAVGTATHDGYSRSERLSASRADCTMHLSAFSNPV